MFNTGFVLGFVVALAVVGIIGRLVGAARLARVFGAFAGRPVKNQQAVNVSPLHADVIAALKNLGVPKADAFGATLAASARIPAPQAFEPLFRGALALARKGVA